MMQHVYSINKTYITGLVDGTNSCYMYEQKYTCDRGKEYSRQGAIFLQMPVLA